MKKLSWKKLWAKVGISGLIIAVLFGNLIYMNLRPADDMLKGWQDYTPAHFETLMQSGEPVLVEVYASWCPTCLLQHKALETLEEEDRAPEFAALRVDFDRDETFRKQHNIYSTGLMLIFQNGQEIARETGLVTPEKILAFTKTYEN